MKLPPCNHIIVEVDMDPKVPHGNVRFPLTNNLEVIKYSFLPFNGEFLNSETEEEEEECEYNYRNN